MNIGCKYRIYPTKEQIKTLSQWIGHQRFIYNSKVGEDKYFRVFKRHSLTHVGEILPNDQQYSQFISEETSFLKEVPSQILRNGAYKWKTAYSRFFKGIAGRPAFQRKGGRQAVLITKELFEFLPVSPDKTLLKLGTKKHPVGLVEIKTHTEYQVPNMLSISVQGGQWHVSFSYETDAKCATEAELLVALQYLTEPQLMAVSAGFDRGISIPIQGSDGIGFDFTAEQKQNLAKAERGKKLWQKRFSRRQKGSSNRSKAVQRIAKQTLKTGNICNDFAHKTSHAIANAGASLLVFEDLKIKNMTASAKGTIEKPGRNIRQKAGLNRSILGSVWGKVLTYTKYKGLKNNRLAVVVSAYKSSQECNVCGCIHPENRVSQSEFICQNCGFVCNADLNASLVIRNRGVSAVLNNQIGIKVPKKTTIRRAGTARTSTPVESMSDLPACRLSSSSR